MTRDELAKVVYEAGGCSTMPWGDVPPPTKTLWLDKATAAAKALGVTVDGDRVDRRYLVARKELLGAWSLDSEDRGPLGGDAVARAIVAALDAHERTKR